MVQYTTEILNQLLAVCHSPVTNELFFFFFKWGGTKMELDFKDTTPLFRVMTCLFLLCVRARCYCEQGQSEPFAHPGPQERSTAPGSATHARPRPWARATPGCPAHTRPRPWVPGACVASPWTRGACTVAPLPGPARCPLHWGALDSILTSPYLGPALIVRYTFGGTPIKFVGN